MFEASPRKKSHSYTFLTENLEMNKLSSKWIPRKLIVEHKLKKANISRRFLTRRILLGEA